MKVVNLSTTPIKGLQLHHPASVEITARGATGDREFFFVDKENTMISMTMAGQLAPMLANYDASNATLAILENGHLLVEAKVEEGPAQAGNFFNVWDVEGVLIDGPWNQLVSDRIGKEVRLVKAGAGRNGSDVEPLSLVSSASMKALEDSAQVGP